MSDEVPFDYYAKHDDRHGGWFGVYSYPRNGVQHVAYVRSPFGGIRHYPEDCKEHAEQEAARALVDALNAEQKPVEGREIEFAGGKRARVRQEANRIFERIAP